MKIEDILEEKHIKVYDFIVSHIEKTIQKGENLTPLMGVFTKNSDSLNRIPFPPELLNDGQSKAILDALIRKFIEYLKEKGDEPYAFIMLTEAWLKRMSKEEFAEKDTGVSLKNEIIKDEIFMLSINSIKGDIIFSYDVIRDENSSLYVASENSKVLLSYTPEDKEKNSSVFSNRFLYF